MKLKLKEIHNLITNMGAVKFDQISLGRIEKQTE